MNTLSLENINRHAPYGVRHRENDFYSFYFETDFRWFNTYEHRDLYIIRTAEGLLDGVKNFTALFSRKDNPRLEELLAEFEETISIVFD